MKNCKYCGAQIDDAAVFCTTCGANQNQASSTVVVTDAPAKSESYVWWTVLGFLIPILALILWAVWKDSEPQKALAIGKGGLMSLSLNSPIIGLVIYLVMKEKYPDIAKACGICAIVSVGLSMVFGLFFGVIYFVLIMMATSTVTLLPIFLI